MTIEEKLDPLLKRIEELLEIDHDLQTTKRPVRVQILRMTHLVAEMKRAAEEIIEITGGESYELPEHLAERFNEALKRTHNDPRTDTQVLDEGQGVDDGSPPL